MLSEVSFLLLSQYRSFRRILHLIPSLPFPPSLHPAHPIAIPAPPSPAHHSPPPLQCPSPPSGAHARSGGFAMSLGSRISNLFSGFLPSNTPGSTPLPKEKSILGRTRDDHTAAMGRGEEALSARTPVFDEHETRRPPYLHVCPSAYLFLPHPPSSEIFKIIPAARRPLPLT